jgi:hypothetical protein
MLTSDRAVSRLLYYAELEARLKEEEEKANPSEVSDEDEKESPPPIDELNLDEEDDEEDEEDEEEGEGADVKDEVFEEWISKGLGAEL